MLKDEKTDDSIDEGTGTIQYDTKIQDNMFGQRSSVEFMTVDNIKNIKPNTINIVWKDNDIADKIANILKDVKHKKDENHKFGKPFVTAYQLAIIFAKLYPNVVDELPSHQEVGGTGIGVYTSLAQYLARQISEHYEEMKSLGVEGAFLSKDKLSYLEFSNGSQLIMDQDSSIFRYNPNNIYSLNIGKDYINNSSKEWDIDLFNLSEIIEFKIMKDIDNKIMSIDLSHNNLKGVAHWRRQVTLLIKLIEYRINKIILDEGLDDIAKDSYNQYVDKVYEDAVSQLAKYLGLKRDTIKTKVRKLSIYDFKKGISDLFMKRNLESIRNIDSELVFIKRTKSDGGSSERIDKLIDILITKV